MSTLTAKRLREAEAVLANHAVEPSHDGVWQSRDAGGGGGSRMQSRRTSMTTASRQQPGAVNEEDPHGVGWTSHWPFPSFTPVDGEDEFETPIAVQYRRMQPESDDSDSDDAPPQMVPVHPLASDWVSEMSHLDLTNKSTDIPTASGARAASHLRNRSSASTAKKQQDRPPSAGPRGQTPSQQQQPHNTVTKKEITALISIFDPNNALGAHVNLQHMDLQWMVRKPTGAKKNNVQQPAVHLHLGNVASSLASNTIKDRQILINSPRSAIVLLRNGVQMDDLKRPQLSLNADIVEKKPFVTLEQLSWEQRRYLALEAARQAKLRQVTQEYEEVCNNISLDEIVGFCKVYRPDRPSTAMQHELLHDGSEGDIARHKNRSPHEQCRQKLSVLMTAFNKREDRINKSKRLLHEKQEEERRSFVDSLVRAEQRAQSAVLSRQNHAQSRGIVSRGRSELWRAQRARHDRVENFNRMVTRENLMRRLDEVACVQKGMNSAVTTFRNSVWKMKSEASAQRLSEERGFLRRAKQEFLENQK